MIRARQPRLAAPVVPERVPFQKQWPAAMGTRLPLNENRPCLRDPLAESAHAAGWRAARETIRGLGHLQRELNA